MIHLLEGKDPRTRNHSQRVAALAHRGRARASGSTARAPEPALGRAAARHRQARRAGVGAAQARAATGPTEEDAVYQQPSRARAPDPGADRVARRDAALHRSRTTSAATAAAIRPGLAGAELPPRASRSLAAANFSGHSVHEAALWSPTAPTRARTCAHEARCGALRRGRARAVRSPIAEAVSRGRRHRVRSPSCRRSTRCCRRRSIDAGGRILVADDNATNRQLYAELLDGRGLRSDHRVANGAEALEALARRRSPT